MAQFARSGTLFSLENVIDTEAMAQEWNEGLITDGSVDGHMVGVFIKVSPKGFIWYNPQRFEEKGYEVPEDFEGLDALVEQIKADGTTPWGIGLAAAPAPRDGPAPTGSRTSSCASPGPTSTTPGGRAPRRGTHPRSRRPSKPSASGPPERQLIDGGPARPARGPAPIAAAEQEEEDGARHLGIALVVVIGVPLITAGYAFLAERLLKLLPERRRASYRPWLWLAPASPS